MFDKTTGRYHLFFAAMSHGCGLLHYQTNSYVAHAVSQGGIDGPWEVLPTPALMPSTDPHAWDSAAIHGPEVHFDPSTRVWLLFYMGTSAADRNGSLTRPDCTKQPDAPIIDLSRSRRIGLAWSASLDNEVWHRFENGREPILSPRGKPMWDSTDVSNAAPLVFENGSVLMAYRGGGDGVALGGGIGMSFAEHWNQSQGFQRVEGRDSMLFAAEDGHLWKSAADGSFHMLVHRFASGNGSTSGSRVGGHAFSADGWNWHFDRQAVCYNTSVSWSNGSSGVLYRRERPKLFLGTNDSPELRLFSGAWPCHFGPENVDHFDTSRGCDSATMSEALG